MIIEETTEVEKDQGFTLVELLIVIVILGILATIVVFAVRGITDEGQKSSCKATAKTYEVAIEAYAATDVNCERTCSSSAVTRRWSCASDPRISAACSSPRMPTIVRCALMWSGGWRCRNIAASSLGTAGMADRARTGRSDGPYRAPSCSP